jgi:hypothetical protein
MYYANGDRFDGNWELDKKQGHGIMFYANGEVVEGEWVGDQEDFV